MASKAYHKIQFNNWVKSLHKYYEANGSLELPQVLYAYHHFVLLMGNKAKGDNLTGILTRFEKEIGLKLGTVIPRDINIVRRDA